MEKDTLLHNQRGAILVMREVLIELALSNKDAAKQGVEKARLMRERIVGSTQPDALLAGLDAELAFWEQALSP